MTSDHLLTTPPPERSTKEPRKPAGQLRRTLIVGGLMATAVLAMPTESRADFFGIFDAIFNVITGPISDSLTGVTGSNTAAKTIQQQTVFPLALLNAARGFTATSIQTYRATLSAVASLPMSSATLVGPQQFEALLHSRDASQVPALQDAFTANYGTLPALNQTSPEDRVMIDIDDALGRDNFNTTVAADEEQDKVLAIADSIENQIPTSTPASVPYLTAQSQVANLRSIAYTHKLLASEIRQEAARLAHETTLTKRNSESITRFGKRLDAVLTRQ